MTAFAVPENLALESYDELIRTINEWMDRNDLDGSAPAMIALCEATLRRELASIAFEATAGLNVQNGKVGLPTDYDFMRSVLYEGTPLDEVSPEIGRQFQEGTTPRAYSVEANQICVWPSYTGALTALYQTKLTPLTQANQSNTILLQHPDVYFFGALMFAEGFVANDSRAALFKALWDEAILGVKRYLKRQRRDRSRLRNPAVIA